MESVHRTVKITGFPRRPHETRYRKRLHRVSSRSWNRTKNAYDAYKTYAGLKQLANQAIQILEANNQLEELLLANQKQSCSSNSQAQIAEIQATIASNSQQILALNTAYAIGTQKSVPQGVAIEALCAGLLALPF